MRKVLVYFTHTGVQIDVRYHPYVLWMKSIESCGFYIDERVLKVEALIQVVNIISELSGLAFVGVV